MTQTNIIIDGPILSAYIYDPFRRTFIMGPKGSGKSVGSCLKLWFDIINQEPASDGVRYSRMFAVRNTIGDLEKTTIKTWQQWFDKPEIGYFYMSHPYWHKIMFELPDGTSVHAEVHFLALDKAKDQNKLNSMEAGTVWVNEFKDVDYGLIKACEGVIGRYPSGTRGKCTRPSIIGDTNPPDDDHWLYPLLMTKPDPDNWHVYRQPPAAFKMPDGSWRMNDDPDEPGCAENLKNLPTGYYKNMMVGAKFNYINVYVGNNFDFVTEGTPIIKEYDEQKHLSDHKLYFDSNLKIFGGIDYGRKPALVLGQKTELGEWRIIEEHTFIDTGADRFAAEIIPRLTELSDMGFQFGQFTDDPDGSKLGENDDNTTHIILQMALEKDGLDIQLEPAETNNLVLRCEAIERACKHGLLVSNNCKITNKGLKGGYCFKSDSKVPVKNKFSHPVDACQYMVMGAGDVDDVVVQMQMGEFEEYEGFSEVELGM